MRNFIVNALVAIIAAAATWAFTQIPPSDEINHIEYTRSTFDGYLPFDTKIANEIVITSGGKRIENISSATIVFANTSKKNLENIDVIFEIERPETGVFPEVIGKSIKGPDSYPSSYITEAATSPSGSLAYNFKVMNVTPDLSTNNFQATFLFPGKTAPRVTPKIVAKGVSAELFDVASKKKFQLTLFLVIYVSSMLALVLFAIRSGNVNRRKFDAEFSEKLGNYYELKIQNGTFPTREEFAGEILKSYREKPQKKSLFSLAWSWLKGA